MFFFLAYFTLYNRLDPHPKNKINIGQRDVINPSNIFTAKETPNEIKRQPSEQEKKKKFKAKILTKKSSPKYKDSSGSSISKIKQKYPIRNGPKISMDIS